MYQAFSCIALLGACCVAVADGGSDPVDVVLRIYADESKPNSGKVDGDFYPRWRTALVEVARANTTSPYYTMAMKQAVGLTNSEFDYPQSESLAVEALTIVEVPRDRALWFMELGEIRRERVYEARSKEKQEESIQCCKQAIEAFRNVDKEIAKLPVTERSTELIEYAAIANSMAADLCMGVLSDSMAAEKHYSEGLKHASSLKGVKGVLGARELGYDTEHFANAVIVSSLANGEVEMAKAALKELSGIQDGRYPASYYAVTFGTSAFTEGGDEFQKFVSEWVANNPRDGWTCVLLFHSARDLYRRNDYEPAEGIYVRLLDEFSNDLLNVDKKAIADGRGGFMAAIYKDLIRLYQITGRFERAEKLIVDFKRMFPNDSRTETLSKLQKSVVTAANPTGDVAASSQEKQSGGGSFVVANAILVASLVAAYLGWRAYGCKAK